MKLNNENMTAHEQVIKSMQEMKETFAQVGVKLLLPPPSNSTLGTRYSEIDFGKMLTAEIPFDMKFANPISVFQGGFLCAVFDEVYGPLSYMAAGKPVVTIEMSTTFIRPFTAADEFIVVRAELVVKTKSLMVFKAEAKNKNGKLIATSTNHSMILNEQNLK